MKIEKATEKQLKYIVAIATKTRMHMLGIELKQWTGDYPNFDIFRNDIKRDGLFVLLDGDTIIASISVLPENDEAYKEIEWIKQHSMVIHRVIVNPIVQKQGIGMKLFDFAINLARKNGYESIKVDTHPDNYRMQGLIKKMHFKEIGYLSSINRLAYELVL